MGKVGSGNGIERAVCLLSDAQPRDHEAGVHEGISRRFPTPAPAAIYCGPMPVIVKMQLLQPKNASARTVRGALCSDRARQIIFGLELEEPELLTHFEGRDFAFFEVEPRRRAKSFRFPN
jgi:hypothetical protein